MGTLTPANVAVLLRQRMVENIHHALHPWEVGEATAIMQGDVAGMAIRYFDMTLNDGRVYRVRVSDITPEGE